MEEKIHSKLGASSYKRWSSCPASVRHSEGIESKSSVYAEEGTEAHAILELMIRCELGGNDGADVHELDERSKSVPQDMWDAVCEAAQYIIDKFLSPGRDNWIEERINLTKYHPQLFGTADFISYDHATHHLSVVDYKHGAGVPVEIEENGHPNLQLVYYALGALHQTKVPATTITVTIIQPRCYHKDGSIRSKTFQVAEALDYLADLIEAAKRTEDPNAAFCPGDYCRWCPGQATCPAIKTKAIAAAKEVFAPAQTYTPEKLAETLSLLPQIESWCKSVREFAYREAEAGRVPPGYKLVDKRATRKWAEDFNPSMTKLSRILNEKDWYDEPSLKSPAQIEKILKKEEKYLLEEYVVKESSGKNLVPINDDRQSVESKAREVFGIVE